MDELAKKKKKPYMIAIMMQVIYTGIHVRHLQGGVRRGHEQSTYVFIFYRQLAAGSLLLLPLALLLHRTNKNSGSMSFCLLLKLFMYSLIGITFSLNLYHVSLKFTSATVASATDNALPAVTFFLALFLRMEVVKVKSPSGIAKLTGVVVCLAGVAVIALYKGPALSPPLNHHRPFGATAARGDGRREEELAAGGAWVPDGGGQHYMVTLDRPGVRARRRTLLIIRRLRPPPPRRTTTTVQRRPDLTDHVPYQLPPNNSSV